MAQTVKNLPSIQETWVRSLGREDPLGKGMATHVSILARRIPWKEELEGLKSMGSQSQDVTEVTVCPCIMMLETGIQEVSVSEDTWLVRNCSPSPLLPPQASLPQ